MAEGSTVTMERTFVWCPACREVRWGEQLANLAQLERDLAATSAREPVVMEELSFSVSRHQTLEDLLASRKKELESRIAWRRIRKSPPRCLECGYTDVTPLVLTETDDGDEKWTSREHPGCGGIVTVLPQMVLSLDRRWFRYTPEGEKKQAYACIHPKEQFQLTANHALRTRRERRSCNHRVSCAGSLSLFR
jgi:hypothetical protein